MSDAGEVLHQAAKTGVPPVWGTGTAQGYTDENGEVEVLLDLSSDDETVVASVLCGWVADQEKVRTVSTPDGSLFVVGSMGGQPHCVGTAFIEGGNTDIAVVSVAAVEITDLRVAATIPHSGHVVKIETNVFLSSGGANNTLTGRIMREDPDGTVTEIGRFLRSSALANGQTVMAGVPCFDYLPEAGPCEYYCTVTASVTGWTIVLSPATTPEIAAALVVTDMGSAPPGTVIT